MISLRLTVDCSSAIAAIDELSAALPKCGELPPEIVDRLINFVESGIELSRAGLDGGAATDAFELCLVAQPSDRLLRLVTALRAGNFNLSVVENALRHDESPSVGVCTPTAAESPAARKSAGDDAGQNSGDIDQ